MACFCTKCILKFFVVILFIFSITICFSTFESLTVQRYAKFETGDERLTNEDRGRLETVVGNEVLRVKSEKKSRQYCYRLCRRTRLSPTTISRHLKLIGKVKK